MSNQLNRRGFFTALLKMTGVAVVAPVVLSSLFSSEAEAQKKRGESAAASGGSLPLVDANDPVAKAVKYVEDGKKAADSKGNKCAGCGFYSKKEVRNGKEVGTCTIFAGKVVHAEGWCASWNKKA